MSKKARKESLARNSVYTCIEILIAVAINMAISSIKYSYTEYNKCSQIGMP